MKALKIGFAFALILMLANTGFTADEITVTPTKYEELSIPAWMVGPIWVQFEYDSCNYSIVHVLTDSNKEPYLLLVQEEKDITKFKAMTDRLRLAWSGSEVEGRIIDRGDDICQVIDLPSKQHWESDNGEANINHLSFTIREFARSVEMNNLSIKIYFKGNLPVWAMKGLSLEFNK